MQHLTTYLSMPRVDRDSILYIDCKNSGWAVLVYTCLSYSGQHWKEAWAGIDRLDEEAFLDAGGNGHSVTNSLWYISTRPDMGKTLGPDEDEAVPSSQV